MTSPLSLVADIGGTNTRVALARGHEVDHGSIRRYPNADYPALEQVLAAYLGESGGPECGGACVAVAGPVDNGVARLTNRDWVIDPKAVAKATSVATVHVLNDLQAQGHALSHLERESLRPLIPAAPGRSRPGPQLVVGVGTGFNAACVIAKDGQEIVTASESGHVTLPVRTEAELRLAEYVEQAHGFAGVEDVLSGRGLERLFAWHAIGAGREDRSSAAEIMAAMADGTDDLLRETGLAFVRLLGRVVGDLALSYLPFGGVHLIGGVARAFTPHYEAFGLRDAFRDKGRFSAFMDQFPVFVIEDDYAALTGCAAFLDRQMRTGR
ncbi:MAG: glucokinase [Paracoccaceae bacterium]